MDKIWTQLPYDMVREVLSYSDDIDVRLAFKLPPKKLSESRIWRLFYLLNSHDGIIYNLETETLHNFRIHGCHMVRRPIKIDFYDDGYWYFNLEEKNYNLEMTWANGEYLFLAANSESWITDMRVLLRGSGLCRAINFSGQT